MQWKGTTYLIYWFHASRKLKKIFTELAQLIYLLWLNQSLKTESEGLHDGETYYGVWQHWQKTGDGAWGSRAENAQILLGVTRMDKIRNQRFSSGLISLETKLERLGWDGLDMCWEGIVHISRMLQTEKRKITEKTHGYNGEEKHLLCLDHYNELMTLI